MLTFYFSLVICDFSSAPPVVTSMLIAIYFYYSIIIFLYTDGLVACLRHAANNMGLRHVVNNANATRYIVGHFEWCHLDNTTLWEMDDGQIDFTNIQSSPCLLMA